MSGSIKGQVLNQRDGQPISGASCRCQPQGGDTQSDPSGNFAYDNLPAGSNYDLVVSKTGFHDGIYGPLVVVDGTPTELVVALQPKDI